MHDKQYRIALSVPFEARQFERAATVKDRKNDDSRRRIREFRMPSRVDAARPHRSITGKVMLNVGAMICIGTAIT